MRLFLIAFVATVLQMAQIAALGAEIVAVQRVVDGDTIEVQYRNGTKATVRLLRVDTPEMKVDDKENPAGVAAKEFTERHLLNKTVVLESEGEDKDKYGRILRYVWFDNGVPGQSINFNLMLVENGQSAFYTKYREGKYKEAFMAAEAKAKEGKLGIWGDLASGPGDGQATNEGGKDKPRLTASERAMGLKEPLQIGGSMAGVRFQDVFSGGLDKDGKAVGVSISSQGVQTPNRMVYPPQAGEVNQRLQAKGLPGVPPISCAALAAYQHKGGAEELEKLYQDEAAKIEDAAQIATAEREKSPDASNSWEMYELRFRTIGSYLKKYGNGDAGLHMVECILAENPGAADRQRAIYLKGYILCAFKNDISAGTACLKEALAIQPDSQVGKAIVATLEKLEAQAKEAQTAKGPPPKSAEPPAVAVAQPVAPRPTTIKVLVLKDGSKVKVQSYLKTNGFYNCKGLDGEKVTVEETDVVRIDKEEAP